MKYQALNSIRHNGKLFSKGETLELDDKTAGSLLACGAIAPKAKAEKEKAAKPAPERKGKNSK
ncbi:hypothetical protein ACH42_17085 [Endozoicomonas sp. (ex Bugula neritina AB1)]|nr:hypothetical protein ACH42_17085 [Endozoicomonas sp. (ex Bugula neritina AB1)]